MKLDSFLACFFPELSEPIHIRGFSPKELPEPQRESVFGLQTTREIITGDKLLQQKLLDLNKTQGLYFVPNSGGFKDQEINRHNAVFCEIDDLPLIEQHDLYDNSPLPPSIRVETKKSVHAYWLLERGDIGREQWLSAQCGLIDFFHSDAGIKNPNRVMRLPYFNHLTWVGNGFETKKVTITHFDPDTKFNIPELLSNYPFTLTPAPAPASYNGKFDDTIEGIAAELKRRIAAHPTYKVESDGQHATALGICHNAVHGKTALMVNLRTGAVFCHAGCDYWQIASAFGLEKPARIKNGYVPRKINRTMPQKETGKRLMNYVYGEGHE